jgi:hypothetical protein
MQLCLPEGQIEELPVFLSDLSSRLRNLAYTSTPAWTHVLESIRIRAQPDTDTPACGLCFVWTMQCCRTD